MKKHIILWSGGKDSTATIILCHIHQIPIDEIIFTEVMYDKRRNISGELPEHIHFIKKVAKPLFEEWGYKVTILSGETDYLSHFNRIIENPTKHMAHKGKSFGFPLGKMCAVRRDCKIKVAAAYVNQKYGKKGYHLYVGICADEEKRLVALNRTENTSLLAQYGITQQDAKVLCKSYGLLSPAYQYAKRGGCWFCPYAKVEEHAYIKRNAPKLWAEFIALEERTNLANSRWNPFKETLKERNKRL